MSPRPPLPLGPTAADPGALAALEERNRSCAACKLRPGCTQVVVSDGDPRSPLVVIGEGPGAEEDRDGRPFVGQAGLLLDRILTAAGIAREQTYLTNIVKCRAPGNRAPEPDETQACTALWLLPQLALLRPRVVLALGNTATQFLLGTEQGITRLRGQWFRFHSPLNTPAGTVPQDASEGYEALLMPMLHPAYLLRNPARTPGGPKALTWGDIQEVARVLGGGEPREVRGVGGPPGGLFD